MNRFDRRIPFFLIAAAVSFLLRFALLSTEKAIVKNVPTAVGIIYLVLALLFQIEWLSNNRAENRAQRQD